MRERLLGAPNPGEGTPPAAPLPKLRVDIGSVGELLIAAEFALHVLRKPLPPDQASVAEVLRGVGAMRCEDMLAAAIERVKGGGA